jgi:hypothetical protein
MSSDKRPEGKQRKVLDGEAVERVRSEILQGAGHRQPPRSTRFQKGQSGNPNGRPRAPNAEGLSLEEQPLLRAVHERASKTVRMREGDTVSDINIREALFQSTVAAALKGNARSQGLAFDLIRSADIQRARDRADRQEFAKTWQQVQRDNLEAATAAGTDTRLILPHPDDIVIDGNTGYHLVGPFDETSLLKVEASIRYRDALVMQDVLDERLEGCKPRRSAASDCGEPFGALLFAIALDTTLPPRFRIDCVEIIRRQMRYDGINLRQLLKETYAAWKAAGVHIRRGARFANLKQSRRKLGFLFDLHRAVNENRIDIDAFVRSEFNNDALDLVARYGLEAS